MQTDKCVIYRPYMSGNSKYLLAKEFRCVLPAELMPEFAGVLVKDETGILAEVNAQQLLRIHPGYTWDGPSVVPDMDSLLRASLVHDVFYQLLRDCRMFHLGPSARQNEARHKAYRAASDRLFAKMAGEDGWPWKGFGLKTGLWVFGGRAAIRRGGFVRPEDRPQPKEPWRAPRRCNVVECSQEMTASPTEQEG